MELFRKILPRKSARDQYSFELLKSSSAQEFRDSGTPPLPRCYSSYDNTRLQAAREDLAVKMRSACNQLIDRSEEVIDFMGGRPEMSDTSSLIGFVANQTVESSPGCSYGFASEDPTYEKAIAECHSIRECPQFTEGVLLKCTDRTPLFPYLHFAHFAAPDHTERLFEINEAIRECGSSSGSLYGGYDEVYSIQKTASVGENSLPSHRHAGFIVIGFKILDDANKQQSLERTWLSWTGAREIYKHSPRNWNLRRISLLRHPEMCRKISSKPFVYILMCEYGSILHPSNTIQAMDMCERLRVRNCGHVALYQVHTAYSAAAQPVTRVRPMASPSRVVPKRNPMMRGFSQDVETHAATDARRNRLRHREKSFQCSDEQFHAYQY